jgi:hypothetical protein
MPTFERCGENVTDLAKGLMRKYETHKPIIDAKVRIDFLFAYGDRDGAGNLTSNALTLHGVKASGIAKKTSLKDRAKGLGDAEILLDGDWWAEHSQPERLALLDHELHHISVMGLNGVFDTDDLGRPKNLHQAARLSIRMVHNHCSTSRHGIRGMLAGCNDDGEIRPALLANNSD